MKTRIQLRSGLLSAALLLGLTAPAKADVFVGVDPGATWLGYMNVFDLPADGGAYVFGSSWGTADLNATFSGGALVLTPNTSISRDVPLSDAFWWKLDGSGNKNMDANMYVQDDSLAGQTVVFSGLVLESTLVSPYVSTIFVKDFMPDYSSFVVSSMPVSAGPFSLTLATAPGHHVQYGFETIGPNASLSDIESLGAARIAVIPEPGTVSLIVCSLLGFAFGRRRAA